MADILFSTSFDDKYPPNNILNSSNAQFWTSTGLYPQEIYVRFENEKIVNTMQLVSYNIKKILVESCENDMAVNFIRQSEQNEVSQRDNKLQDFTLNFNTLKNMKIIKITILDGYDEFCSITSINFK